MSNSNKNLSFAVSILLFLSVLVIVGFFPSTGLFLVIGSLICSVIVASIAIIRKHGQAYQRGGITRAAFIRNAFFEVTVILFAAIIAGLLGRHFARLAAAGIPAEFPKLVAGLLVGVLVGAGVGYTMYAVLTIGQLLEHWGGTGKV